MSLPRKIRALLVTTGFPPEHSGSGSRLGRLYDRLSGMHPGLEWKVVTKRRDPSLVAHGAEGAAAVHGLFVGDSTSRTLALRNGIKEILWARDQIKSGIFDGVDLVHCAGWTWFTWEFCRAAKRKGIPIIRELTSVGDGGLRSSFGGRMIRSTNGCADLLVAISPHLRDAVWSRSPGKRVWCRPNPIEISRFHFPSAAEREAGRNQVKRWLPSLSGEDLVILHVGRVRPLKNQLILCEALRKLPRHYHLLMVGPALAEDGAYVNEIRRSVASPDLSGRAHLEVSLHREVECLMQGADICTLPSHHEGLGTVMLEALCTGLPVVASVLPGVTDWIIRAGENGFLCNATAAEFSSGLLAAASLVSDRRRIAAEAASRFDSSLIDSEYWRQICGLLGEEGGMRGCGREGSSSPRATGRPCTSDLDRSSGTCERSACGNGSPGHYGTL